MFWKIFGLIASGLLGGIFGGMGMGGGTLLIPLLALFCKVPQHIAQAINLVSFVPMAVIALIIHIKKKRVDFKGVWYIIIPACIVSVGGALLAQSVKPRLLSILFGIFLGILGAVQLIIEIISIIKSKKSGANSPAAQREKESESEVENF